MNRALQCWHLGDDRYHVIVTELVGRAAHLFASVCRLFMIVVNSSDVHARSLHAVRLSSKVLLRPFLSSLELDKQLMHALLLAKQE